MFNSFNKNPLQCSVLLCSALQAMGGRLSAAHSFQSLQSQLAGALLGMSCACLRVFECKNAPFNPDKLGTVLTLLGRGDTQDPARTQRDLFRFCHNAIPMYVGLAATHGLLSAGGEPGGVCASVLYLPSYIYIVVLHIYVEVPIKHSTTFCNYHSIL